jgi:hypothetical protein
MFMHILTIHLETMAATMSLFLTGLTEGTPKYHREEKLRKIVLLEHSSTTVIV